MRNVRGVTGKVVVGRSCGTRGSGINQTSFAPFDSPASSAAYGSDLSSNTCLSWLGWLQQPGRCVNSLSSSSSLVAGARNFSVQTTKTTSTRNRKVNTVSRKVDPRTTPREPKKTSDKSPKNAYPHWMHLDIGKLDFRGLLLTVETVKDKVKNDDFWRRIIERAKALETDCKQIQVEDRIKYHGIMYVCIGTLVSFTLDFMCRICALFSSFLVTRTLRVIRLYSKL
jgi:hypothetical protein